MLKEEIMEIFQSEKLQIKWMEDNCDIWNGIVNKVLYAPVYYDSYFVKYQNQYFSEVYDEYIDISFIAYNGGISAFIMPLCIYKKNGEYFLGAEGGAIYSPLLSENIQNEEGKRKILKKCLNVLKAIAHKFFVSELQFRENIMSNGLESWERVLLENSGRIIGNGVEAYVNLSMQPEAILKKIRRTNKYSIIKGKELWDYKLITKDNTKEEIYDAMDKFRQLHIEVAGRETRSIKTWELQREGIINSDDFLVMLYDKELGLIGASLYQTTNTAGMYSVAAYNRELFDKPIAHVSQWIAICHMREIGIKWYYIGKRFYEEDFENPSDKEIKIGHFKEGFATDFFMSLFISININ